VGIGNYVYVIWPDQVFERFDPASNDWTTLPQVPHAHTGFGATALGGKLYVIGGENGSDVDVYDPASGAWATRAPIPNGVSVRTAVTLRDTIFTFASTDQLSGSRAWASYPRSRQVMAYVPQSDAWFPRSDGPGGSIVAGPIVPFQGKLYLFGGYSEGTRNYSFVQTTFSDSIYTFDPDSNLWSFLDRIPDWRVAFHAVEHDGAIYLLGGLLEWQRTDTLTWTVPPGFAYDGAKQGWYLRTVPGVPLDFGEDASLASAGSAIYFVNGGNRWPGTMGRYAPGDDACGVDVIPWEDTIPYGIPFTEGGTAKSGSTRRLTVGEPRPRR
jgi:N-acetylneuraminic acid mutarotase